MKTIPIILTFLLVIANNIRAQDIIILTNGDEIQSIVTEIGLDVIKYHKFDNQTGPLYNIAKSQVFMIKYQNGTKDVFTQQSKPQEVVTPKPDTVLTPTPAVTVVKQPPQYLTYKLGVKLNNTRLDNNAVRRLYAAYPEATALYNSGAGFHGLASALSWLEIGMLFLTGYAQNHLDMVSPTATKESVTKRGLTIIGCMMVVGVSCNISGHSKKKQSVAVYNAALKKEFEGAN